jgi:pyruvate/2-oxoacid:ferredoxin oxidoreductase alpha subunit
MMRPDSRMVVDGNEAAASVAHRVSEVIAIYPITPYVGHPETERVIVQMGSGTETAHETVDARGSRRPTGLCPGHS